MSASRPGHVRIAIVEDEDTLRELLEIYLRQDSRMEIVARARSLAEAREVLAEADPDVVLLDYELGDGKGLELIPGDGAGPGPKYVVLTSHADPAVAEAARRAGARGFMLKTRARPDELVRAIHVVATEGVWFPEAIAADGSDFPGP